MCDIVVKSLTDSKKKQPKIKNNKKKSKQFQCYPVLAYVEHHCNSAACLFSFRSSVLMLIA